MSENMNDPVNNPSHYTSHPSGIECIQITEHMCFNIGNAIKYLWRSDEKGAPIEDLKKAAWYIEREIARRENKLDVVDAELEIKQGQKKYKIELVDVTPIYNWLHLCDCDESIAVSDYYMKLHNPKKDGYYVIHKNSHEVGYIPPDWILEKNENINMTFGLAIESLKFDKKVARSVWGKSNMWLHLMLEFNQYVIGITLAGNESKSWVPLSDDMFAEDWMIVE